MALAEALKSNTTLKELRSAALPSNPPAHALRPHSMHARLALLTLPPPCAQAPKQQPRPRGWHGARRGPEEQYHPRDALVCCPAIKPTRPCVTVLHSPPCFRVCHPLPLPLEASQHPPRPRLKRDQPFPACVPDESRTRTAHTPPAHTQSTLLACRRAITLAAATHARATPRGPRPRPPLPTGGWRARVHPPACTCPSQAGAQRPRRRRRAGPQSGRPQRPHAKALASGRGAFHMYGPPLRGWQRPQAVCLASEWVTSKVKVGQVESASAVGLCCVGLFILLSIGRHR